MQRYKPGKPSVLDWFIKNNISIHDEILKGLDKIDMTASDVQNYLKSIHGHILRVPNILDILNSLKNEEKVKRYKVRNKVYWTKVTLA
jgi:membrane-bound ClpP family serine protease